MTADVTGPSSAPVPNGRGRRRSSSCALPARPERAVVGVLPDGTVFYVPRGQVHADAAGICCHLCGFWYGSLTVHLRADHGWHRDRYVNAFGLDRTVRLEVAARDAPVPQPGPNGCPRPGEGPR